MDKLLNFVIPLTIFLFFLMAIFLLFFTRDKRQGNQLLAFFFLCLGLAVLDVSLQITGIYYDFPKFAFWFNGLPFLYGPLLYFYTRSNVFKESKLTKKDMLHFFPFILSFLAFIFIYHQHNDSYKLTFLYQSKSQNGFTSIASSVVVFVFILLYIVASFRLLSWHKDYLEKNYSQTDKLSLHWLSYVLYGFLTIIGLSIFAQIGSFYQFNDFTLVLLVLLLFVMLGFVIMSIFKGLQNSQVFMLSEEIPQKTEAKPLTEEQQEIKKRIVKVMESKQVFLNPELKLDDLSKALNLPQRQVSEVINQGFGKSFFDLINANRISYVQQQILENSDTKKTILEFMYEAGFNSKSSFNTAFKKHTGKTPTQWKANLEF